MADWNKPLPAEAVEGAATHVADHNKIIAAFVEVRSNVDGIELTPGPPGDDGDPGGPGDDGHSPVITWDGTTILVDGVAGPDLKGAPGDPGADGAPSQEDWAALVARVDALDAAADGGA